MDLRDASASKNKMQKGVKYKCNLKHHFPGLDPDALGVWFHSLLRGSDREGFLHHCAFLHHSNAGVTLEHWITSTQVLHQPKRTKFVHHSKLDLGTSSILLNKSINDNRVRRLRL